VEEARQIFADEPTIQRILDILARVGLGYLTLGQPAPSLSGGESQRLKLARELGRRRKTGTLYILDEPTTGLSYADSLPLLRLLNELADQGHSIIVIEHDPVFLSACDWLIELGPGGGDEGGRLIAQGPPSTLRLDSASKIGPFLEVAS
jgi:excinuclease UvrABC ATPase subunit